MQSWHIPLTNPPGVIAILQKTFPGDYTMILTRSEASVQLTYAQEEYKEFNDAVLGLRNEIAGTLRNEIPNLHDEDKEYFETLMK
jgi:hypothetical protein